MTYLKIFLIIFIGYSFTFAQMNLPQGITGEISINDTSTLTNLKKQVQSLPIPEIIYPPNNATDIPIVPKFIIGTINQANRYEMELSLDQSFFNKISRPYWEFEESLSIDFLEWFPGIEKMDDFKNNTNYYWRVRALNTKTNETSSWSQTFKYKTKTSDESVNQPTLIYPENNSNIPWLDVNFQWDKVQTSNWYQVQWSISSIFNGFTYHWSNMENLSYKTNIKPDAEYYCRVIAFSDNSVSQFSLKVNFNTGNFVTLTDHEGTFDDGSSSNSYENNKDIYWLIQPPNANNITLNFLSFNTETNYDFVTVYDGSTINSAELGKFSGNELPTTLVSTNGSMLVRFETDGAVTKSGWKISYSAHPIKILVEGPYLSLSELDEYQIIPFYWDHPISGDTLALKLVLINNQYPSRLYNIGLQVKLNSSPLELHLKEVLDINNDGLIDQIPYNNITTKNYISLLLTKENLKGKNENLILETRINKINGVDVNIKSIDTISYYTALQPNENRTFDYFKDAYSFPNPDKISFKELAYNYWKSFSYFGKYPNLLLSFYQWWSSLGGRCYGMTYTAGDYFLHPENKPIINSYPYYWDPPNLQVMKKITDAHISQVFNSSFWRNKVDFNQEFLKVLNNLKMGNPSILCMTGDKSHAVLITDLLKINNKAYFEVYDNRNPNYKYQAIYDVVEKQFSFDVYKHFSIDAFTSLNKINTGNNSFVISFINYLNVNSKKVFATFGKTNFLLTDSYGRRIGYLENGSFINEIQDSWIYRLPADSSSEDSITVFYVPNDEAYEMKFYNYGNSELRFENHSVNNLGELTTNWIDSVSLQENSVCYYDEGDQSKSLVIDYDNDGTIDSTISTIETVTDLEHEIFNNNIIPLKFYLSQNYPNPFNPSTKINYSVPHISFVTLKIYDILGREVATLVNEEKSPGNYEINFNAYNPANGTSLSSGIYFYRIQAGEFSSTKKLILLK